MNNRINYRQDEESYQLASIFEAVINALNEIRALPLIAAHQMDDELPRQRIYNALATTYLADLDKATRTALSRNGELQPDLWNAFCALVEGERVTASLARAVTQRCGRLYRARRLSPGSYFRPKRNGSVLSHQRVA